MATYVIVSRNAADSPGEVVGDLPTVEIGEVLFHRGSFWRVDAIESSNVARAEGRLLVSRTRDKPKPA